MLKKMDASLDNFIEWLRMKDPNESYDYYSCANCAVGQFGQYLGVGQKIWLHSQTVALNHLAAKAVVHGSTFGELLKVALQYRGY